MKKLVIIGAGGHGRVVADIASTLGIYDTIAFLDDAVPEILPEYPILGTSEKIEEMAEDWDFFVAIGNNTTRKRVSERVEQANGNLVRLVHPTAVVSSSASIGIGTVVMPGAVINAGAKIGKGCIVNTCASVDHDCCVGDYCHVAVGAHLCGTVQVGQGTWVGAGATVINNIDICENCMIGAGALVNKSIMEKGTFVGVPARYLK